MGIQGCLKVSPASEEGTGSPRGTGRFRVVRDEEQSPTLLSLPGATATSHEKGEHPDKKTEAKEPCQDQGLLRCEGRGGTLSGL